MRLARNARWRLALILVLALPLGGCMQFEYGIVLERDLSGTANIDMTLDFDRIAYTMATLEKSFSGIEGAPTEEEIAAARQEMMDEMGEEEFDEAELRREIEGDLPEGMELLDVQQSWEDLKMNVKVDLGFENVTQLNQMAISRDEDEELPVSEQRPFGDLEIIDEGGTLLIRNEPVNPLDETEEASEMMPGLEAMFDSAFADLRIVFKITAPFDIVEHNATRRDGKTLYWEYGLESLEKGAEGIMVRYRK
ncbi:MAG: hypothetical protein JSU87_09890 [Gemmatimonadota bacterium]|nr:MAG: hypothetical protein JSU87_09890 [Gemmatimonadota bacterium]